ncbi:MAG: hypothetical protein ACOCZC_02490 [Halodesulfurarchaeum sp.]
MPDGTATVRDGLVRAVTGMAKASPMIFAVVLLLGLLRELVPPARLRTLFGSQGWLDLVVGTAVGSVSTGNAVTSYVIGGELLVEGISLGAVTAFLVAWVTVGVVQLPAEAEFLGRRFAVIRNATSAISAVVVALLTVGLLGVLP